MMIGEIIRKLKTPVLVLVVIGLAGCSTSGLSIRLAYSRMDDNIASEFNEYAEFDREQREWIRAAAREFQIWHRKYELPLYADLSDELALLVESGDEVPLETVRGIFDRLEGFSRRSYANAPFANSIEFLEGLSDEQVEQIAESFEKQNERRLERIREQDSLEGYDDRIDRFDRTLGRIGLSLTEEQRDIIDDGLSHYVGSREDRIEVWRQWQLRFLDILEGREREEFTQLAEKEIREYQSQMEIAYPERSAQNTETAAQTITALLNSLKPDQREEMVARLRQVSEVFRAMANSKQTEII